MEPRHPRFSADGATAEPWRLARLARTDGRVRELMRALTREPSDETAPMGEIVWARHVLGLHDDGGTLVASVTHELGRSPWLSVVTAVLRRAWDGEGADGLTLLFPDGRRLTAAELLPEARLPAGPRLGLAERPPVDDAVAAPGGGSGVHPPVPRPLPEA